MKASLAPGVETTQKITIDEPRTISFLGDEGRVYSTPSMVRDVEYTALQLIGEHLDEGESSVGMHVSMDHLGATPLGAWVEVRLSVTDVDRRKVTLEAEVRDAVEVVGRGRHVRFVIDVERHRKRLEAKLQELSGGR